MSFPFLLRKEIVNQNTGFMGFTASEAAKLMDSTPSDVARFGQTIVPDTPADGKGYRSFYSFRNVVELKVSEGLARFGVPWKRISRHIKELRESRCRWFEDDGLDGWLVLDRSWKWGAGTTLDMAVMSIGVPTVLFIVVDIGTIKRGIRRARQPTTDREFAKVQEQIREAGILFKRQLQQQSEV